MPGLAGPCDVPGVSAVCDAVGSVWSVVPNPLGAITGYVADAAETAFTHWLADGAASVLGDVVQAADRTLTADLGPRSFLAGRLQPMLGLVGGIALLFLLVTVGHALVRGDPALIVSALLVRLPVAFGATTVLLFLTGTAVAAVDQATTWVLGGSLQQSSAQFIKDLGDAYTSDHSGSSLGVVALCALGTILVGILLYIELAVRTAVIYLAVLFMPLALAASVWQGAGRMARRLADVLVTAILAKFVILVSLSLAAGLLADAVASDRPGGFGRLVVGLIVVFLAAGAPMVLLGLVSHAEHAVAAIADTRRAAYMPIHRGVALARTAAGAVMRGGGGAAGGLAIVSGGGRVPTQKIATGAAVGAHRQGDRPGATPVSDGSKAASTSSGAGSKPGRSGGAGG
ncbi:MAG TPA: hypothetical protein VN193_02845 [Candidatus Angelobacter sp.]|nr:hypothetical protein [Candidatus Angelobacter sp.]